METEINTELCQKILKNGKQCKKKPCKGIALCSTHHHLNDEKNSVVSSNLSSEEMDTKLSIVSSKNNDDDQSVHRLYAVIDSYFENHYKRCKILSCLKDEKKTSSFDLSSILTVGLMSIAPLLIKNFSPNINNATHNNIKDQRNEDPKGNNTEDPK